MSSHVPTHDPRLASNKRRLVPATRRHGLPARLRVPMLRHRTGGHLQGEGLARQQLMLHLLEPLKGRDPMPEVGWERLGSWMMGRLGPGTVRKPKNIRSVKTNTY